MATIREQAQDAIEIRRRRAAQEIVDLMIEAEKLIKWLDEEPATPEKERNTAMLYRLVDVLRPMKDE